MLKLNHIYHYFLKIGDNIMDPKLWAVLVYFGVLFSEYVFNQWSFAIGFFIIWILDTVSGVYVAFRTRTYSGKVFREKLADKSIAYGTIIIAFSAGTKVVLHGSDINLINYLNLPFYSLFIAAELRSIVLKWYEFKKWAWLGALLELFDKNKKQEVNNAPNSHATSYETDEPK